MVKTTGKSSTAFLKFAVDDVHGGDKTSKPDPFVVVFVRNRSDRNSNFEEVGRTEWVKDKRTHSFTKLVSFPYRMADRQELRVQLYDSDSKSADLARHDLLATFEIPVAQLMTMGRGSHSFKFGKNDRSTLGVTYEKSSSSSDKLHFKLKGDSLKKMDTFGKSDPYAQFFRKMGEGNDAGWTKVFETSIIKKTLNPEWVIDISMADFCNNDTGEPMLIKLWDWDNDSSHDLIGEVEFILEELIASRGGRSELLKDGKAKKRGYVVFEEVVVTRVPSLMDLMQKGLSIQTKMAVDYTASNGSPNQPSSLHFLNSDCNPYLDGIMKVGGATIEYDDNNDIDLVGFGGALDGSSDANHCFALRAPDGMVGLDRAVQTYKNSFQYVELSGPTRFSGVLSKAVEEARASVGTKNYHLLMLFTDGAISASEMNRVKDLIVTASELPISIVIVCVGSADFSDMDKLDGDSVEITDSRGFKSVRDIVNTVKMNEIGYLGSNALAEAVLEEFPSQVESHYTKGDQRAFA
jgi:Copine/C2 domain